MQSEHPQSVQSQKPAAYHASCQPRIALPQLSRWGSEPALSPVADRVPRVLGPPHACRGRVARIVLLPARGSCESRVPNPSDASKGDPAKCTVDEVGDRTLGLILPMAAPEAPRADRPLLSAVRHELFGAAREPPPCPYDEADRRGHRPQQGQHGARRPVLNVLSTIELAVRLEGLDLVVLRHLGCSDVDGAPPSVVVIRDYTEVFQLHPWSTKPTFRLGRLNALMKKLKTMPPRCCYAALRCAVSQTSRLSWFMAKLDTSVGCRQAFIPIIRAMRCGRSSSSL